MGNWLQLSQFTTDECIKLSVIAFVHLAREPHTAVPQCARFSREEESRVVLPGKITPATRT